MSDLPGFHGQWISTDLLLPALNDVDGDLEVLVTNHCDLPSSSGGYARYDEAASYRYWRPTSVSDKRHQPGPIEAGNAVDSKTTDQSNDESGYQEIIVLLVKRCPSEEKSCSWKAYGGSGLTQREVLWTIPDSHDQGTTRLDHRWVKLKVPSDSFSSNPVCLA